MIRPKFIILTCFILLTTLPINAQINFDLYSGTYSRFERLEHRYLENTLNGYQFGFHLNYAFPNSKFEIGLGALSLFSTTEEESEFYNRKSIIKTYQLFPELILNYNVIASKNKKWRLDAHLGADMGSHAIRNEYYYNLTTNEPTGENLSRIMSGYFVFSSKFGVVNRWVFENNNELRFYLNLRRTFLSPNYFAFQAGIAFRFAKNN